MENRYSLDVSRVPDELKLIIDILKIKNSNHIDIDLKRKFNKTNWRLFLELALHHRIYPLLRRKLKTIDGSLLPPYIEQTITQYYRMNTFQMLNFSGEMEQVGKLFTENNIKTLFLKGPVLGADLYGDISLRTSGDIDFLIEINDLEKAEELLLNNGYVKDDYIQTVLNDWKWRHHHVTYFHDKKNIKLEIHWRLNPGPGKEPNFAELWRRKRISNLTSYPVYYLGREDLFLFLVSHGARHGWSRLRWLIDIDQLVKQGLDWKILKALLKKYQYLHIGGQALYIISQLFNTPISEESKSLVKGNIPKKLAQGSIFYLERMINLHNEPLPNDISRYHKRHLFLLMSMQQKIFFMLSFLYPYPEDAKTLPLPQQLHFLYFPLRPFLWAWRKTKDQALS